ncbi:hypothetical protein D9757_000291 [Collybiopsis confluens]|uniref:DUF6593 domain-containing protein n=1 Tax=Collybiopsis confluens TaxID=2823264 RepID=A0A8H5I1Z0_9AGAR|nr:hypothetical protein D9757_000291 [Collybiopsis confluens]
MNLYFSEQKPPLDSNVFTDGNIIVYNVKNTSTGSRSMITKFDGASRSHHLSDIELHSWHTDKVTCNGQQIPFSWSLMNRKLDFKASDGNEYRWKLETFGRGAMKLVSVNNSDSEIAVFDPGSSGGLLSSRRPATLQIRTEEGVNIADEIIITWAYSNKRWHRAKTAAAEGAAAAAAAAAAAGEAAAAATAAAEEAAAAAAAAAGAAAA